MAVPNEYYELLQAYALGCLDKSELDTLKEYFNSGGEYPWQELGEYQNLASLFPSILNMELPSPQLKDRVARKLYRVRDVGTTQKVTDNTSHHTTVESESKQDITPPVKEEGLSGLFNQKREDIENESPRDDADVPSEEFNNSEETEITDEEQPDIQDFEVVTAKTKEDTKVETTEEDQYPRLETVHDTTEPDSTEEETEDGGLPGIEHEKDVTVEKPAPPKVTIKERQPYSTFRERETSSGKSSKGGIILAAILFVIVAAGLVFVYLKISSDVTLYKNSVDKLNRQIKSLSSQVNNNQDLQKILSTKNVRIVNLSGTRSNQSDYGKLIISFENSRGYLQLSNVPPLQADHSYQLWVLLNKKYTSLGLFKPSEEVEYFPFSLPALTNRGETKFIISEEPSEGSVRPTGTTILTGSMQ